MDETRLELHLLETTNLGGDVGTQYRSGIYYYNDEQERLAKESLDSKQNEMKGKKIVTEILYLLRDFTELKSTINSIFPKVDAMVRNNLLKRDARNVLCLPG
ncbi:hypothetical protein QQ045_009526 [Rhodiola kirilowii]